MKYSKFLLAAAVILIIASLYGCSLTATSTKMVTPEIRALGLPDISVIESVTLKVSGPDMDTVEVSYSVVPSVINLAIPEGDDITFELSVKLSAAAIALSPDVATSYRGTATADISTDSAVVTLNMGVGSTKIVVPDPEWNSGPGPVPRILQFDDINDLNATELNQTALNLLLVAAGESAIATFVPYDIDFDNQGRIYIANNAAEASGGVIRVDNITGLNPVFIGTGYGNIQALAIDQQNNVIYYTDGNEIYRSNLDGSNEILLPNISTNSIAGLDVDDNAEFLYYIYHPESFEIAKYNLNQSTVVNNTNLSLNSPRDVLVKDDKLYVANFGGADEYQILELSTSDLSLTNHYGNSVSSVNTTKGNFYGPHRFVAQMNDEITIIDDFVGGNLDKIIQMDNIDGANWKTLPESGNGQSLFHFF